MRPSVSPRQLLGSAFGVLFVVLPASPSAAQPPWLERGDAATQNSRTDDAHSKTDEDPSHEGSGMYHLGGAVGGGTFSEERAQLTLSWRLFAAMDLVPGWRVGVAVRRVYAYGESDGYGQHHNTYGFTALGEFHLLERQWADPYVFGELGYGRYRLTSEGCCGSMEPNHDLVGAAGLGFSFRGRRWGIGPQLGVQIGPTHDAVLADLRVELEL